MLVRPSTRQPGTWGWRPPRLKTIWISRILPMSFSSISRIRRAASSFPSLKPTNTVLTMWLVVIGVIYGVRWVPVSHFLDWGYRTPLFKMKRWRICCHLLSIKAICGDWITIKPFSAGSATDPAGRAHDALSDPRVGWGGNTSSPFSSPLASELKGASFSFWIGTPLLDQSYDLPFWSNVSTFSLDKTTMFA